MMFRRKPQVVTAEQFKKENQPWPNGVCICTNDGHWGLHVHTPEGTRHLTDRMWVLRDLEGNFTAMDQADFENLYDPA